MTEPREQPPSGVEIAPRVRVPEAALRFTYASSSGPGGQNVNKRATKAILRVALDDLPLTDRVRDRLARLGKPWLVGDDAEIVIQADEHRSQKRNRDACLERLRDLIVRAQARPKPRIATSPTRGAIERRLKAKRRLADKKRRRGDGSAED